jgi:hypothetical protein
MKQKKQFKARDSKVKKIIFELSKQKKEFHRSKFADNGVFERLTKFYYLSKGSKPGYWFFNPEKIKARGYSSLKELASKEAIFRNQNLIIGEKFNDKKFLKNNPKKLQDAEMFKKIKQLT